MPSRIFILVVLFFILDASKDGLSYTRERIN